MTPGQCRSAIDRPDLRRLPSVLIWPSASGRHPIQESKIGPARDLQVRDDIGTGSPVVRFRDALEASRSDPCIAEAPFEGARRHGDPGSSPPRSPSRSGGHSTYSQLFTSLGSTPRYGDNSNAVSADHGASARTIGALCHFSPGDDYTGSCNPIRTDAPLQDKAIACRWRGARAHRQSCAGPAPGLA